MHTRLSRRLAAVAAALTLFGGVLFGAAGTASADTFSLNNHFALDGSLWLVQSNGHVCHIYASTNLTSSTCLNASLVRIENHGYTSGVGGKVYAEVLYNQSFQNGGRSAYWCVFPGEIDTRTSSSFHVTFNQVNSSNTAGTGQGKAVWNDVAQVKWVTSC